jgi:hypothetical protein
MQAATLLHTSAWLLAGAATAGALMAGLRFGRDRAPPAMLSRLHGLLAASGTALLIYGWATAGLPRLASLALLLIAVTAASGLITARARRWWNPAPPVEILLFGHMCLASMGFLLLLVSVMSTSV